MTPSQRRNPMALNGMITTPHYLASQAGLHILRGGGNAVEAAIAAAAALTVVYPQMCTLGGDNFWLIYNASSGELRGLNASGRAGRHADREVYEGMDAIPSRGPLAAITVPGVVSGWEKAHKYSGKAMNGRLEWSDLLEEAIALCSGVPVSESLAGWLERDTDETDREQAYLQRFAEFARVFLPDGRPLRTGEVLVQEDLRETLVQLAQKGPRDFYEGQIARRLVDGLAEEGGLLTMKDFRKHTADWVEPIGVNYRGLSAYNLPPNTQGVSSLQILAMLAERDMKDLPHGSADYYHYIVEATKLAFADRERFVTDPEFAKIPLKKMLSVKHARECAARIDMAKAQSHPCLLAPKGDTIWLGVVDKEGNAVSLIQSIYNDFGSAVIPRGTGVILQNRGSFFSLDPDHINTLEPGKRTMHTLNPPMILKDGRPLLVYGTMGGEGQPQTQAALVTRILDFGMSPQEAVDAPRWLYGRTWGAASNSLKMEGRVPEEVRQELAARGHDVETVADYTDLMGHAGAILIDRETNPAVDGRPGRTVLHGAADPRGDGLACGC
ncbi:MAG: gamma-glutamyltransferase [Desulfovibrionaceae bacterium]|nr:gamma-glutamyltransferase [Desulfovibrionaceae bacterium]